MITQVDETWVHHYHPESKTAIQLQPIMPHCVSARGKTNPTLVFLFQHYKIGGFLICSSSIGVVVETIWQWRHLAEKNVWQRKY